MKITPQPLHGRNHEINVGARLRVLRQTHNMSQRALARRAGVTSGTISLIEQNKVSPSVASLKRLLDSMTTSLAEFFSIDDAAQRRPFFTADDMVDVTLEGISYRHYGRNVLGRKLEVIRATYKPGADSGDVENRPDGQEIGLIIRGRIEVAIDGETDILGPGDGYYIEGRQRTRFRNRTKSNVEYICVCTPPGF